MKKQQVLNLKKIAKTDRPNDLLRALQGEPESRTTGPWPSRYTASGKVPAGVSPWTEKFTASGKAVAGGSSWHGQFTATGKAGGKPPQT